MRLVSAAVALLAAWPAAAAAPQFPADFRGVWAAVGEVGAEAPSCKASDFDEHTNDGLISVKGASVLYLESGCDLNAVVQTKAGTSNLTMSCSGEGMTSKSRETWAVRKVKGEDMLVVTTPSRSTISLYVRCR